ncbi:hypothetical protein TWF696_004190 [Orbilia brochopaga]|uniref:MYND-type domain-containing protein n=1 Tax=Orbilia brochopaga TaxID=3140254 RepID=A0AAV9V637_9PEZI
MTSTHVAPPPTEDTDVLILQLADPSVGEALLHHHGDFLDAIKARFGATTLSDADQAINHIVRHAPALILAVDSGFASSRHRRLQDTVATAVRNGSAFIMCCDFAATVTPSRFKKMILNAFNLGWEFGRLRTAVYSLYFAPEALINIEKQPAVEHDVEMTAVQLYDVEDESRLYIDEKREGKTREKDAAPIVCERLNDGYVMYVGDVYNISSTKAIILTLMHNVLKEAHGPKRPPPPPPKTSATQSGPTRGILKKERPASESPNFELPTPEQPKVAPLKPDNDATPSPVRHRRERNTAPLNQRGPCLTCGKASTTRACNMCKAVFFCSSACQNIALKTHKETCAANRVSLAQAIALAEDGNPAPLVKELIHIHEPRVAIERLIDAYRLRIEDLHDISGIDAGHYMQSPDHTPPQPPRMEEFITFLRHMQDTVQIVRPHWWDLAAQTECEDLARNHVVRMYIGRKADEGEIVAHYGGEGLMPKALRVLGDVLYGCKVPEPEENTEDDAEDGETKGFGRPKEGEEGEEGEEEDYGEEIDEEVEEPGRR